jgi:hypothetical protein
MDESERFDFLFEGSLEIARQVNDAMKPQWEARKDVARTLITLSSAALLFTITFASSFITSNTLALWRYGVMVCWLSFICSLALSLFSLWLSTGLHDYPGLLMGKITKLREAANAIRPETPDSSEPFQEIVNKTFKSVAHRDTVSRRLVTASLIAYGIALLIFIAIGMRQLIP